MARAGGTVTMKMRDDANEQGHDRRSVMRMGVGLLTGVTTGAAHSVSAAPASDIVTMDAVSLQRAIRTRSLSCFEVMTAYLDQIERLNPAVNAVVALQPRDALLRQANVQDAQLSGGEAVGILHGFPHAMKDLQPVKGIRYTQGSPIFRDRVATADGAGAERLRKAGVIFIGKTNTPEFGLGSQTYNPVYGATRNAYDRRKSAGGSSGGAAVSLALRMVPLADGSDYGGSLRNPAGWNGVYGFRHSLESKAGQGREVWLASQGVQGPMARTVADLALLNSVLNGLDASTMLKDRVKGKRIAWLGDFRGALPFEPDVLDTCRTALKTFETLGCAIDEAVPDYPLEKAWQAFVRLRGWQTGNTLYPFYKDPVRRGMLKPEAVFEVETGLSLSSFDIIAEADIRAAWSQAVAALFDRYDYLIVPTAQVFAFDFEQTWPRTIAGRAMRTYHEWMAAQCVITLAGCPSLAVPAGFGPGGQPMGIQIIAPVGRDADCFTLAAAYEAASGASVARSSALLR